MPSKSPIRVIISYFAWFLSGVAVLISIPFLLSASMLSEHNIWHDVIRDVGIAFLVAAIVAAIYELHVRSRFDVETMTGVLDATIGDIIRPDIWEEVKREVIERGMIRQNVSIHLRVKPLGGLPGPVALWMKFEYDLCGLHARSEDVILTHELDDHIAYQGLPEFEYIKVGERVYKDCSRDHNIANGKFSAKVRLNGRNGKPIHVVTTRREVTYIPGSHSLVMSELAKGFSLHLMELPPGIEASINCRPHTDSPVPLEVDGVLGRELEDVILLPGQAIEFRLKRKAAMELPSATAAA
ncbi:MAG: hypothetical protein QOF89_1872 [Acidobacteriota bacterium]|jgi:hypothetical protein|nr:hypothetical protein [Acidobacteriota bacterium]